MKILWVEDFGGGMVPPSSLVEEVFGEFFEDVNLWNEFDDSDGDIAGQLYKLFAKHTTHEIHLCRSYLEWKKTNEQETGDFDLALIDINLDRYRTPKDSIPKGVHDSGFDAKAGLYVYHQLVKQRFPEDNIAIFSAESKSVRDFLRSCNEILLDSPKHVFEKTPFDFEKLRRWLMQKVIERRSNAGIKVLLVDDEKEVLANLAARLRGNGYEVSTAENGTEALRLTNKYDFDAIVTDISMPGLSGLEFIALLPKKEPPTRVIVMTGFGSRDAIRALNLHAFYYLEKGKAGAVRQLLHAVERATWEKTKARRGRKLRVFLCHAAEDAAAVRKLNAKLRDNGFDPWLDKEKLLPGQEWEQEILTAVKSTDAVIICLSRASVEKEGFVQKEIRYALQVADEKPPGTIFLIPLRLEQCETPPALERWQRADVFDSQDGFDLLLSALRLRARSLGLSES